MCEFISWIENGDKIHYLTYDQIYNTPRGEILRKTVGSEEPEDLYGHGAIRKYYELPDGGRQKECTGFSKPTNFPGTIADAIKEGKFAGLATPRGLLLPRLYADYQAKRGSLDADYQAKCNSMYDDFEAKRNSLDADYEAKRNSLDADYMAKRNSLYADYQAKRNSLYDDFEAKRNSLDADYEAKRNSLYAGFWGLFAIKKNRAKVWR
jgi:hypothetical protein